jgi:hypothetical protein
MMISKSSDTSPVAFSVAVYRFLLAAYPRDFREEYGVHMLQVFRDCCIRALRQNGAYGIFRLWAVTLFDFIRSVIEEHLQKETNMSKSTLIRIGGWALVLGGLNYLLIFINIYLEQTQDILYQLSPFRAFSNNLIYLGPIFLVIGLLGLRERYGEAVGTLGKNILLVGAVGALMTYLGVIKSETIDTWMLFYFSPAFSLACLTVFGITALKSKPLPRWNGLPIIAGVWFPLAFLLYLTTNIFQSNASGLLGTYVLLFIQYPALMVLGFILQADVPREEAIAAV